MLRKRNLYPLCVAFFLHKSLKTKTETNYKSVTTFTRVFLMCWHPPWAMFIV